MRSLWPGRAGSTALLVVAACCALGGCGGSATQRARPSDKLRAKLAIAQATHEYPSPKPPPETASGGSPSAVAAIRSFANAYINWSAGTIVADLRSLASRSVGQARSAMQLAAAQTAGDYQLQQAGIANSGTVEAVALLAGSRSRYVVVTQESTTATNTTAYQGLRPAWHVTIATVSRQVTGAWVLSGWQPEN